MEFRLSLCFESTLSLSLWSLGVPICAHFLLVGFIAGRSEVSTLKLSIDLLCFFLLNFDDVRYRLGVSSSIYVDRGVNLSTSLIEVVLLAAILKAVSF